MDRDVPIVFIICCCFICLYCIRFGDRDFPIYSISVTINQNIQREDMFRDWRPRDQRVRGVHEEDEDRSFLVWRRSPPARCVFLLINTNTPKKGGSPSETISNRIHNAARQADVMRAWSIVLAQVLPGTCGSLWSERWTPFHIILDSSLHHPAGECPI